jgi:hypothetical protein
MSKCWIYHAEKEPMIIDSDEAENYYSDGWADSPAKFVKTTDFGIEPEDKVSVQQLGETIEGVKDMANGALNLDEMKDKELKAYAKMHFGKEIKGRGQGLVDQVQEMINGNRG